MDVSLLHEFAVLAQSETFLKAADILFISQPTLSRHIKNLETELGVPLFDRTTRSVKLSKYGAMFLPYANQIVDLHNRFTSELLLETQEQHLSLRIGTIPAMSFYGIADVLSRFKEKHERIKMDILPSYTVSVIDMLRKRNCELAFIRECESDHNEDVVRLPFLSDYLVAVVPQSHPLAAADCAALSQFKNDNIITLSRETVICEIVCSACAKAGFEPNLVMTDHNIDHIIECVRLGMGTALVMDKHADTNRPQMRGLKALRLQPVTNTSISLCYLKGSRLSDAAREFVKMFKEEFALREPVT